MALAMESPRPVASSMLRAPSPRTNGTDPSIERIVDILQRHRQLEHIEQQQRVLFRRY
jgi:hypothetical protein